MITFDRAKLLTSARMTANVLRLGGRHTAAKTIDDLCTVCEALAVETKKRGSR